MTARRRKSPQEIIDQMPACRCACGCVYPLRSSRSLETLTCLSCRIGFHYGGRPLLAEPPPRDES